MADRLLLFMAIVCFPSLLALLRRVFRLVLPLPDKLLMTKNQRLNEGMKW